jgi:DEAD/DEAH box helicase domain-containing protein
MARSPVSTLAESLLGDPILGPCFTHSETIPAREASCAPLPEGLSPRLKEALASRGVESLYVHQAEAYRLAERGEDFCVVTPTASGKTLCYNLPVLQCLLKDGEARALYLFPTKALSQDQQSELNETLAAMGGAAGLKVATYDGDTPSSLRVSARDTGRIIITNPDMLHSGILPNHPKWHRFFEKLAYVVVDEMHAYRGIFGAHVANVIRRLLRVAAFYGSKPRFIFCSATIGNPAELASMLRGAPVALVDKNGAPSGEKRVLFYNPPLVDPVQGIRRSVATESQRLALACLRAGIKTILFARSRLRVEVIASYINQALRNLHTANEGIRVEPYRGGFLPNERREIERGLRDGTIQGVVSTNALELGIDIGGLDACVVAGFPGSFSSFWQQAGRAGRRAGGSLVILVASSSPLDQYLLRHPEYFMGRPPEKAALDADNPCVLADHVKCAAFELPFAEGETMGEGTAEALALLNEEGVLRKSGGRFYWSDRSYPSEAVSLRSATADNVVIIDVTRGRDQVIGEMDRPGAKELIYDDAVYLHHGRQYIVRKLDIENRVCRVEESNVNYYTDAVVKADLEVLAVDRDEARGPFRLCLCDVLVRTQVAKFKKIRFHTHENIGFGEVHEDAEETQTRALVMSLPQGSGARSRIEGLEPGMKSAVLSGIGSLVSRIAPMLVLCDAKDLGIAERARDPFFGTPALYVYDRYPGGSGLSEALLESLPALLAAARELAASCPCASGCPSCVGAPESEAPRAEGEPDRPDVKREVAAFLAACLGEGP